MPVRVAPLSWGRAGFLGAIREQLTPSPCPLPHCAESKDPRQVGVGFEAPAAVLARIRGQLGDVQLPFLAEPASRSYAPADAWESRAVILFSPVVLAGCIIVLEWRCP